MQLLFKGQFDIVAGDFPLENKPSGLYRKQRIAFSVIAGGGQVTPVVIPISDVAEVAAASEEQVRDIGGAAALGLIGAVALGPFGLLAGLLAGHRTKTVFIIRFRDGRRLLCRGPRELFTELQAAVF